MLIHLFVLAFTQLSNGIFSLFQCFVLFSTVKRNQRGDDRLYIGPANRGYAQLTALYKKKTDAKKETSISIDGVQGTVLLNDENVQIGEYVHCKQLLLLFFFIFNRFHFTQIKLQHSIHQLP